MAAYTCKIFIEIKLLQLTICITRVFGCSKSPIPILEKHNEVGRGKNYWASCKGIDNLIVLVGLPVSYNEVFQIQPALLDHLVHTLKLITKTRIRIHQQ